MDFLIVLLVLGLSVGCYYLVKKVIPQYNPADIAYVQSLFGISMDIIDELDLKNEPQVKMIAHIISTSLNQVYLIGKNKDLIGEELEKNTWELVKDSCEALQIEITPAREKTIQALIDIGLDTISSHPILGDMD